MDKKTSFTQWLSGIWNKVRGFFNKVWEPCKKFFDGFRKTQPSNEESNSVETEDLPKVEDPAAPATPLEKTGKVLQLTGVWLYRLRKIFMAIPVIWYAMRLASYNMQHLPEQVGLNLQVTGEYAKMIDRNMAVYGPLGITAACLVLMFCSRRARYPWIISIFTLVLPLLILFTNLYPQ